MTITHHDLADLVASLYGEPGARSVNWDYMSPVGAPCFMGIVRIDGILIAVTRGSFTFWDWVRDLLALAWSPHDRPDWGPVHSGFYIGTEEAWGLLKSMWRPGDSVVMTGHSLGAAHARFLAAHMKSDGGKPLATVTWGNPREGYAQFAKFLEGVPGTSYQNANGSRVDVVTRLAPWMPDFPYVHGVPRTKVNMPPPVTSVAKHLGEDAELHHFTLYRPATPAIPIPQPA